MAKVQAIRLIRMDNRSEIIICQTEDGLTKIETRLEDDTVWLTQAQMAELFEKGRSTITEHVNNIFQEGELDEESVCRNFRHTASDGKSYETNFYNLDVIISGKISHQQMLEKAQQEYDKYKGKTANQLSKVEEDFIRQIEQTAKQIEKAKKENEKQ